MSRARRGAVLGMIVSLAACPSPEGAPEVIADLPEATTPGAPTITPTPRVQRVAVEPMGGSGVSAEASLREVGAQTSVQFTIRDGPPNATLAAHIHQGSCQQQGPVVLPLEQIITDATGIGTSVTTVAMPIRSLQDGQHYVQAHAPGVTPGPPVACGDIGTGTG
jgi:hypothetical protein